MNIESILRSLPILPKSKIRKELGLRVGKKLRRNTSEAKLIYFALESDGISKTEQRIPKGTARPFLTIWLLKHGEYDTIDLLVECIKFRIMQKAEGRRAMMGPIMSQDEHKYTICNLPSDKFYSTPEWSKVRYQALAKRGNRCECCGRSPKKDRVVIHVDHIKPRSVFPELALEIKNLQILCEQCNIAKSNRDMTDWRSD